MEDKPQTYNTWFNRQ